NDGLSSGKTSDLVGNPNFVRPASDDGGSIVIGTTPNDTTDNTDNEYYSDATIIDAQNTIEYQYAKKLPYSDLPNTCYFKMVNNAPSASLVNVTNIDTTPSATTDAAKGIITKSSLIAGINA